MAHLAGQTRRPMRMRIGHKCPQGTMKRVNLMKTCGVTFGILLGLFSFAFPNQGWSQVLETAEQHLKQAESYRELVEMQRQDVAAYRKGKEDFVRRLDSSQSGLRESSIREYDELIAEDEALLADFKILEGWHRARAKELEGAKALRRES